MIQAPPQFSVVIPTYNRAKSLHRSLESIFCQTYPPAEIIVVNDGSADDTREVLAGYGDRIKAINQANAGVSGARNAGIRAADSEWIVFLDDDDEHVPDRLTIAAESIALHPGIDVHASNMALINPDGSELDLFALRGKLAGEHMLLEQPLDWVLRGCFFFQAVVVRRTALEEVGLFRKMFYEDLDLFVRLAARRPWVVDGRKSVCLIRLPGDDFNLSSFWRSKPIQNFEALVRIHRDAFAQPSLSESERKFVQSGLATYLFELGCAHLEAGMDAEARSNLSQAAVLYPKFWSRIKARALQLGGSTAFATLKKIKPKRGLFRSSCADS